jgi:hypothetical protein
VSNVQGASVYRIRELVVLLERHDYSLKEFKNVEYLTIKDKMAGKLAHDRDFENEQ